MIIYEKLLLSLPLSNQTYYMDKRIDIRKLTINPQNPRTMSEFMEGKPLSVKIYEIEQPDVPLWAIWAIQQYIKEVGVDAGYKKYGKLVSDIVNYILNGGHPNLRLDENGLMFDGWQRYQWDAKKKEVVYVKDQVAIPLDRKISVGKPASAADLKKRTTIFRADGVDMRDDKEVTMYGLRIHKLRTLGGYQPWAFKE